MMSWYSAPPGRVESSGGNQGAILKNRDGVPVWSGDSSTFEEFVEACLLYEQTVVKEKRYLCGPRIASELSGSARRILIGKSADWLSFDGGVRRLVAALRAERGQSKVPEMSELLMKYFKGTRRQRGEGMNDFVMRKAEAYTRAQQSMARYQREHPKKPKSVNSDPRSQHSSIAGPQRTWKARNSQPLQEQSYEFENEGYDLATEEDDPWAQWHAHDEWEEAHSHQSRSHHTESWKQSDTLECSRDELPEILPDFIQGWYLFMDSGLDVMERNVLQADLQGDFSVRAVETVLRKHWTDADVKRRDMEKGKYMAHMTEDHDPEEDKVFWSELDTNGLMEEGFTTEEIQSMEVEQEKMVEAYAVMQEARQTLREARAKQHAVRMARQYYPVKGKGKGNEPQSLWKRFGKTPPRMQCFRCGGPHKVAECREKPADQSAHVNTQEQAPFVFFTDTVGEALMGESQATISTQDVMLQGKAVIDGGATKTIGSIAALSRVADLNESIRGDSGVQQVDLADRPVFGFGNSSKDQCASTASLLVPLGGKMGALKVHALDKGQAPVLLSISSLRSLGAVIDYASDRAVFRAVDPTKVVRLERTAAGHQVLPLTTDAYETARSLRAPLPCFSDLE